MVFLIFVDGQQQQQPAPPPPPPLPLPIFPTQPAMIASVVSKQQQQQPPPPHHHHHPQLHQHQQQQILSTANIVPQHLGKSDPPTHTIASYTNTNKFVTGKHQHQAFVFSTLIVRLCTLLHNRVSAVWFTSLLHTQSHTSTHVYFVIFTQFLAARSIWRHLLDRVYHGRRRRSVNVRRRQETE